MIAFFLLFEESWFIYYYVTANLRVFICYSASANGGPRSRVWAPIDTRGNFFSARVCRVAFKHLPQLLRIHVRSFRKSCPPLQKRAPEKFRYYRWGTERMVLHVRTRERGPPLALEEFDQIIQRFWGVTIIQGWMFHFQIYHLGKLSLFWGIPGRVLWF